MNTPRIVIATYLTVATLVGGCASNESRPVPSSNEYRPAQSSTSYSNIIYGVVDAIEITREASSGVGAGTVIGGVVGGVLGHQVGGGRGKDVATVAGVVGGAMVGHELEKSNKPQDAYQIRVRLDNGGYQTVTQQSISDLRVGDRARIENNRVSRY